MDSQLNDNNHNLKWQGKVTSQIHNNVKAEQVWSILLQDFCNFHKWLPTIDKCYKLSGSEGCLGLTRRCSATLPPPYGGGEPVVKWADEKLTDIDPTNKVLCYEVMENNMGFKFYKSTLNVLHDDLVNGCIIEWSFCADPVEGLNCDDLVSYLEIAVKGLAQSLEKASLTMESSS